MPAPTIDFNQPSDKIAANIQAWLDYLTQFFNENPGFDFSPNEFPFLKQRIVRGASAKAGGLAEYFVLLEEVGVGALGCVSRVPFVIKRLKDGSLILSDRRTKEYEYAIKDIHNADIDAVKREAWYANYFLRTVGNKPIRPVIVFRIAKHVMFVMPFVPGIRLSAAFIQSNWPKLSFATKFNILWQLTEILCLFQKNNKVHFDIKIDNLVFNETKNKLTCVDYGNMVSEDTVIKDPRGTCGYLAPEMLTSMFKAKTKTDIYAAMAVFLYILGADKCIRQKKINDAILIQKNNALGSESIIHSFHLMSYDQKGLLEGKFQLNKTLTKAFHALLEGMGDFSMIQRADATWVAARMQEIFPLAVAAHHAELMRLKSLDPLLQLEPQITQLSALQKGPCEKQTVIQYAQQVASAMAVVDKHREGLEKKLPKKTAVFSFFFESPEHKHLTALTKAREEMLWPKREALTEVEDQQPAAVGAKQPTSNDDDDNDEALSHRWTDVGAEMGTPPVSI